MILLDKLSQALKSTPKKSPFLSTLKCVSPGIGIEEHIEKEQKTTLSNISSGSLCQLHSKTRRKGGFAFLQLSVMRVALAFHESSGPHLWLTPHMRSL